jgi:hypothetical protein
VTSVITGGELYAFSQKPFRVMKNFLKTNWFKICIVIVLFIICSIAYKTVNLGEQKDLAQNQEKCNSAGAKIDAKTRSDFITIGGTAGLLDLPHTQYIYSSKLNTCIGIEKNSADSYDSGGFISRMNLYLYDLNNTNITFLDCQIDNSTGIYHLIGQGLMGKITENVNGTGDDSKDKIVKFNTGDDAKFWSQCTNDANSLLGVSFFNSENL